MNKLYIGGALVIGVVLGFFLFNTVKSPALGAVPMQGSTYVTSGGFTQATTTINTTSTQVFSSINQLAYITNNTTATITCSLDARNTTAASSTVTAGRGVIIGSNAGTILPARAQFGQCVFGSAECFPHAGAVNCLANVAAVVTTAVQ